MLSKIVTTLFGGIVDEGLRRENNALRKKIKRLENKIENATKIHDDNNRQYKRVVADNKELREKLYDTAMELNDARLKLALLGDKRELDENPY